MQNNLEVKSILDEKYGLNLTLISGRKGIANIITVPKIQKKGLAFAGLTEILEDGRVLIIGNSEVEFLKRFSENELNSLVETIFEKRIPAIIFTNNNNIPPAFKKHSNRYNVPIFKTSLRTSEFIPKITKVLEDFLSPMIHYHGVLLDIHGIGILIEGEAGIGKSELALDMILKGHRFVADDIINIKFIPPNMVIGKSPEALKSHLEIRGLGIINVEELFGIVSLREEKRIDMIVELTKSMHDVQRISIQNETKNILGVKLPFIKLPIANGRNVATLVEMAARIYMMKKHNNFDYDPTKKFLEKLYKNPESIKL